MVANSDAGAVDHDLDQPVPRRVVGGVVQEVVDRAGQALGDALDDHRFERGLEPHVREVALGPPHRLGGDPVESDVLCGGDRQVPAGQLDHVADQSAQLLALFEHVGQQASAILVGQFVALLEQHLHVRAQAGDRGAELVRGVGHQLALGAHRLIEGLT